MTKILIVEDDPSILLGLKDLLRLENYEVLTSEDGLEGTDMIMAESPDLVLLDVNLPTINGFEVCRRIRENNYVNPVIILTARSDDYDKVVGLELGASDYVTKPFNIHELLARIHTQLRSTERLSHYAEVHRSEPERKLLAVMFTDMKDYSLKMNINEKLALSLLKIHNKLISDSVKNHDGKIIESPGDAFVITFESAVKSVVCAYELQKKFKKHNTEAPAGNEIEIRIGIHIGDVMEYEKDIKGDTVNIAARIQQNAVPGCISISENVFTVIRNKVNYNVEFAGARKFKNIKHPLKIYNIKPE